MQCFQKVILFGVIVISILFSQSIEIPNKMMNPSSIYKLPIFIYNAIDLTDIKLEIRYDSNIITVNNIIDNPVGILNQEYNFSNYILEDGVIKFDFTNYSENLFSGSGMIAQIEFYSVGNLGGISSLIINDAEINGDDEIATLDGSIEIILDELIITAQDLDLMGASHSITLGMCSVCIDSWKFGEDEYDYPNPSSGYTNINFYHLDWFGTVDQNQNVCSDIEFATDFRSPYSFRELVSWGIKGSTSGLATNSEVRLSWDSAKLVSNSSNFKIYLYIGQSDKYDMKENSSVVISQSDLELNENNLPNIWIRIGSCADIGETTTYYYDFDGDGLGSAISSEFCENAQPNGWVNNNDDIVLDCFSNIIDCAGICDGTLEYDCFNICNGNAQEDNCGVCDNITSNDCIQDCAGTWGGTSYVDNCGVCDNITSNDCIQDCAGTWGGISYVDNCGVCDNTTSNDCIQDCAGTWGGIKTLDECGVCDGNNSTCTDCEGVPNGNKQQDQCGTCDSNPNNDCEQDCNGDWGGNASLDVCGRCSGGNTGLNPILESNNCPECPDSQVLGCDGECSENGSQKVFDKCEICGGSEQPSTGICDCNGTPNGNSVLDNCGVCDNTTSNDCTQDCLGAWGGNALEDECGVCDNTTSNDCIQDCLEIWGGNAVLDNCGDCDNFSSNDCNKDCLGAWGGDALEDECGVCDNDISNNCIQDCLGVWGGDAKIDNCGICHIDISNNCIQDCNGDWGSDANIDNCGICAGGNTNNMPCQQDCNGAWGGYAFEDGCGVCDLNNNNNNQCYDCFGTPNGSAEIDNCNECILEGESSSCSQGCDGIWNSIGLVKKYDDCGVCGGENLSCMDCLGIINGNAWTDACGDCVPVNDTSCAIDCAGTANGSAKEDNCGVCDNNSSNNCQIDCNGDWGGSAKIDENCGTCIGGQTGLNPCNLDCNGIWGGGFTQDLCGVCDGEIENDDQCLDCNGTINGLAYLDNCGNCIEDSTDSSYECILDCTGVWGGIYVPSYICSDATLVCSLSDCELSLFESYTLPSEFNITKIYPNPFNPLAIIDFTISTQTNIQLNIYNIKGQKIEELKNEFFLPGFYSIVWNAENYPSGIYFVILNNNESIIKRKIMLLK